MILAVDEQGLIAYLRTPAPLMFSDVIAAATAAETPLDDPLLYPEQTGGGTRYRISVAAIAADPVGLRQRLRRAFRWSQDGAPVAVAVTAERLLLRDPGTGFETATAAAKSLASPGATLDPVFGDAVIEVAYRLDAPNPRGPLRLRPGLPDLDLPNGVQLDTHMIDDRPKD